MWVKIKSNKIPNVVLTVPYSAFLNSYQRKGFYVVDGEKAKNKSTKETEIKVSEQEKTMLDGLKTGIEDEQQENEPIIEEKVIEEIKEPIQEKVVEKEEFVEKQVKSSYAGRTPIKKAPSIKR